MTALATPLAACLRHAQGGPDALLGSHRAVGGVDVVVRVNIGFLTVVALDAAMMRDQCRKIISALRGFHSHQHGYPLPVYPINQAMVAAIGGVDSALNPSQVNYFKPWELSASTLRELKAGHFFAIFDFNGDGHVPNPASPDKSIQQDALVWHAGKDGDPTTWDDNVFAWVAE